MKAILELNGQEIDYPETVGNLESLILAAQADLPAGQIIVRVNVDDECYSEDYAHQAKAMDLQSVEKVEVFTCSAETFSRDFLDQVAPYIDHVSSGFRIAIRILRQPEGTEAGFDMLARSYATLGALKLHAENAEQILGTGGPNSDTSRWEAFEGIAGHLHQAQLDGEPHRIADLLEDKMLPFLDAWRQAA